MDGDDCIIAGLISCTQEINVITNTRHLTDRIALVMGGSRGISRAVALVIGDKGRTSVTV